MLQNLGFVVALEVGADSFLGIASRFDAYVVFDFDANRAFFRSVTRSCQADSAVTYFPEEAGLECLFASLQVGASVSSD